MHQRVRSIQKDYLLTVEECGNNIRKESDPDKLFKTCLKHNQKSIFSKRGFYLSVC